MEVTVLAIPDCPNAPVLEQRLAEALAGRPGVTVRHIEIMPRLTRVAGFEWGSGFYINPTPPEEAAKYLRDVKL